MGNKIKLGILPDGILDYCQPVTLLNSEAAFSNPGSYAGATNSTHKDNIGS